MRNIPLFDSLTHPTLTGDWIQAGRRAALDELEKQMETHNVPWAFAVGMKGVGGYNERKYVKFARSSSTRLFPVAYFDYKLADRTNDVKRKITALKKLDYCGIKLHMRFSKIRLTDRILPTVIKRAVDQKLPVFLCTYRHCREFDQTPNSIEDFIVLLSRITDCPVIFLHGGGVNLLEMMEIARAFNNVLLDLSFTLLKYEGSSLDLDIRHLFQQFDKRICVGSDHPEFSLAELRRRFDFFAEGLDEQKARNIAYQNLASFTGLRLDPRNV